MKDRSAVINGKIWNGDQVDTDLFQPGKVAKIGGKVDEYNGKMQIIVESMKLIESPDKEVIEALYASAPMDAAEMYEQIYAAAAKIEIEALREIVCGILADYKERLLIFPAQNKCIMPTEAGSYIIPTPFSDMPRQWWTSIRT